MKRSITLGIIGLSVLGVVAPMATALPSFQEGFHPFQSDESKAAVEAGDYDAWKEIRSSECQNSISKEKFDNRVNNYNQMEDVRKALASEDYQAWVVAIDEVERMSYMKDKITEDNFNTLIAMHDARQSGDFETADRLAEELGLENHHNGMSKGMGKMQGNGMHKNWNN